MATPIHSTDLALGKIHTFEHIAAEKVHSSSLGPSI